MKTIDDKAKEYYSWKTIVPPKPFPPHMGRHLLLYNGEFTGYAIEHCGHQTALRPYSIYRGNSVEQGLKNLKRLKYELQKEHIKRKEKIQSL